MGETNKSIRTGASTQPLQEMKIERKSHNPT